MAAVRDDFSAKIRKTLAARVGHHCSNPECVRSTSGPSLEEDETVSIGVAAHITAAAPGGPRYAAALTSAERGSAANGIHLCQSCSRLIDADETRYTADLLHTWKREAVQRAFSALAKGRSLGSVKPDPDLDEDDLAFLRGLRLAQEDNADAVEARMRAASKIDCAAFQAARDWPARTVALNLTLQARGSQSVTLEGVARAIGAAEVLSFIAPPGTGKSTTLVQLADQMIAGNGAVPLLVPLGEWSDRPDDFFDFLVRRNAYRAFRREHFMQLAYIGRVVLILDGWNELNPEARTRAARDLKALQREYPLMPLVIATRRYVVPIPGPVVEVEPLSEDQQMELARALRGAEGEALIDQAWRSPGVRELVSIPLYLNALLTSVSGKEFPRTKEEVLRIFVKHHEATPDKAEVLRRGVQGFQADMLVGLAVEANRTANTVISDSNARRSITTVETRLSVEGQIGAQPQPNDVLDTLVDAHLLVRSSSNSGTISFQHQQFQEWYGSFEVERLMKAAAEGDAAARGRLRSEVLDWPSWEESILFACERLSRVDGAGVRAVASAINEALSIDPMLAANMIYRADAAVWPHIAERVISFAKRWHTGGKNDRAVRFMITTGRPEFAQQVWPLISNSDNQVHLETLRLADRFRPSVLGDQAKQKLKGLADDVRKNVLSEIAGNSGFDGMELSTELAETDPSSAVVMDVIHSLAFRAADRHINRIMSGASEEVWRALAVDGYPYVLTDPALNDRLEKTRAAVRSEEKDPARIVLRLLDDRPADASARIIEVVASSAFPAENREAEHALYKVRSAFPAELAAALVRRIVGGLSLPFSVASYLEPSDIIDDGPLAALVLNPQTPKDRLNAAASVVGPSTVGALIDQLFVQKDAFTAGGSTSQVQHNVCRRLEEAIEATPQQSFITALLARASIDQPERIAVLAELLARHGREREGKKHPIDGAANQAALRSLIVSWVEVVLRPSANRYQCASVAHAAERLGDPALANGVRRLLEREQADLAAARAEYLKGRLRGAMQPDVTSYAMAYRRAFAAMGGADAIAILKGYLPDIAFGIDAAGALLDIWNRDHPTSERRFGLWNDFSMVMTRRTERKNADAPPSSSEFAEAIFDAARPLAEPARSTEEQRHAIALARVALAMPHGSKRDDLDRLLALPQPLAAKQFLLAAMVRAGEVVPADMLMAGLRELLVAAEKDRWRLDENRGELMGWVELFPFSDRPLAVIEAINLLPTWCREPSHLQRLLNAIAEGPVESGLDTLQQLALQLPEILTRYEWFEALVKFRTEASAMALVQRLDDRRVSLNFSSIRIAEILASMAQAFPAVRSELLQRYKSLPHGRARATIETGLAELADDGCITAILEVQAAEHQNKGVLSHALHKRAVGQRPSESWAGAYVQFGVPLTTLRQRLFAMTGSGDAQAQLAEYCLTVIEELRDELGRINNEPRHPDLASGRPWPPAAG